MAGLLDYLNSDDGRMWMGMLAAAGPQQQPMSIAQRASAALGQFRDQKAVEAERQQKAMLMQAQMGEVQAQQQERAAHAAAMQRQAQQEQAWLGDLRGAFAGVTPQQALANGGGPTNANAAQIGQRGPIDYQALLARNPAKIKEIEALAAAPNLGLPEVARTVDGRDAQGRPVTFQFDKQGRQVGAAVQQWKAPERIDRGGFIDIWDPVTQATLQTLGKTQTPDSVASNKLGWANYGLGVQRLAQEGNAGQIVETPSGYVRVGKDNAARPIAGPDGKPLMGKRADQTLTEDQGKATGWLVQAEQAHKNMREALSSTPSANRPGFPDLYENVPFVGGMANMMRGEDRQKFMQAASSFGEAVLRAATGAGVNKEEALQKARELTPQFGDSDAVVAQKMAAFPIYIESLKVRAGPGAAKAANIGASTGPAPIKFLGFE